MNDRNQMHKSSNTTGVSSILFSVIIPTYQRRDLVIAAVSAFANQEFDGAFEVIVVVDGSEDGSAKALREIKPPFPLTVLDQHNSGRAAALNHGASAARGEILLFLDDDMEAHPRLLAEHDQSYRDGADMVLGHIPLHPKSPSNFLSVGVGLWAEKRTRRLSFPDATLKIHDLITGQASVYRNIFLHLGGFDINFNYGGSFGNEDLDFCHRLRMEGYRVIFNPKAISWQKYVVTPRHHLRQWKQAGRADVIFSRKYPDQANAIFSLHAPESLIGRLLRHPIRWIVLMIVGRWPQKSITARLFFWLRDLEYWQGVKDAGGIPRARPLRVLAYHAIAELSGSPVLDQYGVPANLFCKQLDMLLKAGYHFIDVDEFLCFINGNRYLPDRSLLLTFDDCYEDLLKVALPILEERHIPAVAFAVSGYLGGTNIWDKKIGAPEIRLLDASGLKELEARGIEIGAHSKTHSPLTQISTEELPIEIAGSVTDLESLGLSRPRLFSYPHGEYDQRVLRAVREAGLQAAFTVDPNIVRPNQNFYQIPRIQIFRADIGWKFTWKIATSGRSIVHIRWLSSMLHKAWQRALPVFALRRLRNILAKLYS